MTPEQAIVASTLRNLIEQCQRIVGAEENKRIAGERRAQAAINRRQRPPKWLPWMQLVADLPIGGQCWISLPDCQREYCRERARWANNLRTMIHGNVSLAFKRWAKFWVMTEGDCLHVTKVEENWKDEDGYWNQATVDSISRGRFPWESDGLSDV